jgi:chemotaxis protein MotB
MKTITRSRLAIIKKRESETWIYSYSDLVTNLLAFFMILYIIVNSPEKARQQMLQGLQDYVSDSGISYQQTTSASYKEVENMIQDYVTQNQLSYVVSIKETPTGLDLTFQGALLFDSATADLNPEGQLILNQIGLILQKLPQRYGFDVEGHADARPISSTHFPSNWELSSARAGSVVRYLSREHLKPYRFRAIGYGSTKLLPNTPADHISQRRVVIKIESWTKKA